MRYLFLILPLFLASCATLLNKDYTFVSINGVDDLQHVVINHKDTITQQLPVLMVERSNKPLHLTFSNDSTTDSLLLKPHLSGTFLLGNLLTYGVGYFVDITTMRIFNYPRKLNLDLNENVWEDFNNCAPDNYGKWVSAYFSLPLGYEVLLDASDRSSDYIGGMGINMALETPITKRTSFTLFSAYLTSNNSRNRTYEKPQKVLITQQGVGFVHTSYNWRVAYGPVFMNIKEQNLMTSNWDYINRSQKTIGLSGSISYRVYNNIYGGFSFVISRSGLANYSKRNRQSYFGVDLGYKMPIFRLN